MKKLLLAVALFGAAGVAYAARTRPEESAPASADDFSFEWPSFGGETNEESNHMNTDQAQRNLAAFLDMIIVSEGTRAGGRDPFSTCYAYAFTITDFGDHPANRDWKGVPLPEQTCRAAGFGPGCVSTAAGAYQITRTTWNRLRGQIHLPDFTAESQNRAATELIRARGALADVYAGRFDVAVNKCKKEWASLPGAGYGQGENSLAKLQAAYSAAGGVFA